MMISIHHQEAEHMLLTLRNNVDLIYIDPPFNTGKKRVGRGGRYYYEDNRNDYYPFILKHLFYARTKALSSNGSIFVHCDKHNKWDVKDALDSEFGAENLMNEIIWAYDFGGRGKTYWPRKHDTIFWYTMNKDNYIFNYDAVERIPYMAPGLVGKEKAARGKMPTDVWWHTIVGTNAAERTGYPTQKPVGILERIVLAHSNEGSTLLDFFAGAGSFGEVAQRHNRNCILVDRNEGAVEVMRERFQIDGKQE